MSDNNISRVEAFYSGRSVLVTGGTGFVGKTLIEKLLFSCSGIDKIYVLVRDKYGKKASERLARITSTPAFDRLKARRNEDLKKITVITGDITRVNLGLSDNVLNILEDEAFVHVSTAFTNSDRKEIDEVVYPMPIKLEDARKVAESFSHKERIIDVFLGKKPNTYTFSKAFAEEQVMKQSEELPVAIVRPSIVMSALKEPCPGWIDTWNGSTGLFVGMPAGVLKVVKGRGTNITDLIPVDIVSNLIIVAATECKKSKHIKVYNCCSGPSNPITCDGASAICRRVALKHSLNSLPCPFLIFTPNVVLYKILTFVLQIIPAYIIDFWCMLMRKKATQMKLQGRLKKIIDAVKFFLLNEWKFSDRNVRNLLESMSAVDREAFNFDVKTINWVSCLEDYVLGARKYLLKPEK
nr:putative fatty acyl-CoA reductase CG5065 isoform X2 [Helicoverpa armigera]